MGSGPAPGCRRRAAPRGPSCVEFVEVPDPVEHVLDRATEQYLAVGPTLHVQRPAAEPDDDLDRRIAPFVRGDRNRTGAGAAREGLAHAALPDADVDHAVLGDPRELDVRPFGEQLVMLQ